MSSPHNEFQPIVDLLERGYGDEDPYGYDPDDYVYEEDDYEG